jgi:hypothetical protein
MQLAAFETLVRALAAEIPAEFLAGIAEITVSARTVPHPDHPEVFTLGECIALPAASDDVDSVVSRVVLYHGSFAALAREDPDFDWEEEAWETLTHEIRHHVEWRAREDTLGAEDEAGEANLARQAGEEFDPLFYRDGERVGRGLFRVEDDYFIEATDPGGPGPVPVEWAGRRYLVELPADLERPAFLALLGLQDPPKGEVVLVVRPRGRARWREVTGFVDQRDVEAVPVPE